jgi:hypothetical protein
MEVGVKTMPESILVQFENSEKYLGSLMGHIDKKMNIKY